MGSAFAAPSRSARESVRLGKNTLYKGSKLHAKPLENLLPQPPKNQKQMPEAFRKRFLKQIPAEAGTSTFGQSFPAFLQFVQNSLFLFINTVFIRTLGEQPMPTAQNTPSIKFLIF
jgi:hypothetical protein